MSAYRGVKAAVLIVTGTTYVTVGFAQNFNFTIDHGTDKLWQIGARDAKANEEGNYDVSGSLERAWVDNMFLKLASGIGTLPSFLIRGSGPTGMVTFSGCKATSLSLDGSQDGYWIKTLDWTAKRPL